MPRKDGKRPNFLVILADDLGFSDVGCYGGEINTPNVDKLAAQGIRFTALHGQWQVAFNSINFPLLTHRAQILTGTDNHIAGLGTLIEWVARPPGPVLADHTPARGKPGYEGYLSDRVATLPEILGDAGYHTLCSGKWHLGLRADKSPHARGFHRSFALLPGASNHYGWEPQLEEEAPKPFGTSVPLHTQDGGYVQKLPADWYSSDGYTDILLGYLKDWKDADAQDRPFFAYYAFTAPHWPLQAPQEYIQHYRGVYDDGPDALRSRRLARLKELGLIGPDVEPHPVDGGGLPSWAEMSAEQRAKSCRAMEAYAGMVERMDYNIGRVTDYLESIGELDNTFVLFLSDNGAEGAAYEASPAFHGGPMAHLQTYYDNSLDNIGNYNSFVWYGPRWAQAATAPSRLHKAFTTEGGIRVPFIAKPPASCVCSAGTVTHSFSTVMDIAPTFLDLAGVSHPAPLFRGREVVGMRGRTMVPWLVGSAGSIHDADFVQGWETSGRAAIRKGNWKAVYLPCGKGSTISPRGTDRWELFDLRADPGEIHDLAGEQPAILKDLLKLWDQYVIESGVVPLSPALGEFIAATEEQMPHDGWMEYEYWKRGARENPERFFITPKRLNREGENLQ